MSKSIVVLLGVLLALNCSACKHIEQVEKGTDIKEMAVSETIEYSQEAIFIDEDIVGNDRIDEDLTDVIETGEDVETSEPETEVQKTKKSTGTEERNSITLVMVGDMLMHTPVNKTGVMEDGSIDFSHLFTHTKDMIEGADLALVNQEVILGGEELGISGYPAFNTYQELGDDLVEAGYDVVLHATNHALDKGKKGVLSCLSYWDNSHPEIAVLGIQDTAEEQREIYVYEKNGIRIAILNYTYGTNGIPLPEDMPFAVNLMDKEKMAEDIARAKGMADFVVVCPHWGTEYVLEETDYQRNYAEFMLDCGVDLVVGTHPHVIEPVEMFTDENGNEMLVYYSLGNYVNCTSSETEDIGQRMLGAMAEVTIAKDESGEVYISEYGAQPLVTYVSADQEEIAVYPLEDFTDEMAKSSYTVKFDTDFSKAYCEQLWESVMGE